MKQAHECYNCKRIVNWHAKGLCGACYQSHRRATSEAARIAHRASNKKWKLSHPDWRKSRREVERRYRYNLEPEQYNYLLTRASNRCELCDKPHKKMCIDHNHITGRVRGILCDRCNKALGAYDYIVKQPRLTEYLTRKPL